MLVSISSLSTETRTESLDKYEEDFFSSILRCGLFIGAIFQMVCIASSVLLKPPKETNSGDDGDFGEDQRISSSRLQKFRKQEKKKRR